MSQKSSLTKNMNSLISFVPVVDQTIDTDYSINPTNNVYYQCHKSQASVTITAPILINQAYDTGANIGSLSY